MVACFAQTDDGLGWMVSVDGIVVEDSERKMEIVRLIQSGLNIGDHPFGFSNDDDALNGYLISDIKNDDGRYQVVGFRAERNNIRQTGVSVLQCLESLSIKISPTRKREFLRALNRQSKKGRGWLGFFVLAALATLVFLFHKSLAFK